MGSLSLSLNNPTNLARARRVLASGLALLALLLVPPASAQDAKSVEPYAAVATADGVIVRCGESDRFYRVGELKQGQVVTVDGESASVARIVYPSTIAAYLRADEVKIEGDKATLAQPSKFKAFNPVSGTNGSWKSLLAATLPAGTSVKVIETIKGSDGAAIGYRVSPPEGARAFVDLKSLRRATPEEISGTGVTIKPAPPAQDPPVVAPTPNAAPAQDNSLLAPQNSGQPNDGTTPEVPAATTPVQETPPARTPGTYEALESAFQAVNKQPVMDAEYDELTAEINRAMIALGNTPGDNRIRRQLQARLDVLKMRADYRETVRKLKSESEEVDANAKRVEDKVADVNKTRLYLVVGRLHGSSVYDGKQLPLMYRIQSVSGAPRTLGYLKPNARLGIEKMLGQVVGVVGTGQTDAALKLDIITAERVDVIDSAGRVAPPAAPMTPVPEPLTPLTPVPPPLTPAAAAPSDPE